MAPRYYRDAGGNYLGSWDGSPPPQGAVEVASAPTYATQTWNGSAWTGSAPPVPPSPLDWFQRLSLQTQVALVTAARTDAVVDLALRYASGVTFIDVTDPRTIANVQLLQGKSLITADEAAALLAP